PHPPDGRGAPHRDRRPRRSPPSHARIACRDEGTGRGAARVAAAGRQQLHPAGALRPSRTAHLRVDEQPAPAADMESRCFELARAPDPAVLRRRAARGDLPGLVIMDGLGLNITVMSYNGSLDIGIVADRDAMPDLGSMTRWLAGQPRALWGPGVSRA